MRREDTQLKCTWTNGLIFSGLCVAVGMGLRALVWWFLVYNQPDAFPDSVLDVCYTLLGMVAVSLLFLIPMYLIMYGTYMRLAGNYPDDLHEVARDKCGAQPALIPAILLIIFDVVWSIIVYVAMNISTFDNTTHNESHYQAMVFIGILLSVTVVLDVVFFFLGKRFFKPDLVQKNH